MHLGLRCMRTPTLGNWLAVQDLRFGAVGDFRACALFEGQVGRHSLMKTFEIVTGIV